MSSLDPFSEEAAHTVLACDIMKSFPDEAKTKIVFGPPELTLFDRSCFEVGCEGSYMCDEDKPQYILKDVLVSFFALAYGTVEDELLEEL